MTHTYAKIYFHIIWSTKNRQQLIIKAVKSRLYSYIGGIVHHLGARLLHIGGISDHVHLLITCKPDILISEVIRQIKTRSTKWLHKEFPNLKEFKWQEGYGLFSVSYSMVPQVSHYIQNQETHHQSITFDQEYLLLLQKNAIRYDSRFVLG